MTQAGPRGVLDEQTEVRSILLPALMQLQLCANRLEMLLLEHQQISVNFCSLYFIATDSLRVWIRCTGVAALVSSPQRDTPA